MINFRYHIVSLTAVFLALIIGILMGTTVVSRATVDGLRANLQRAESRSTAVHQTNSELSAELKQRTETGAKVDAALSDRALDSTVHGLLADVPVLIIASKGEDSDVLAKVTAALNAADADLDGTLFIDDSLAPDKIDTDQMADILDISASRNVRAAVTTRLAAELASAALVEDADLPGRVTTTAPDTSRPDASTTTTTIPQKTDTGVLQGLLTNGYLDFQPAEGAPKNTQPLESPRVAEGVGYRYVVVSSADPNVPNPAFLDPLITKLARIGSVPLVAGSAPTGDNGEGREGFLGPLLEIDGVSGKVSTVDDLGSYAGQVALVFALHEAAGGRFGSFGVGDTATTVLPTLTPS